MEGTMIAEGLVTESVIQSSTTKSKSAFGREFSDAEKELDPSADELFLKSPENFRN